MASDVFDTDYSLRQMVRSRKEAGESWRDLKSRFLNALLIEYAGEVRDGRLGMTDDFVCSGCGEGNADRTYNPCRKRGHKTLPTLLRRYYDAQQAAHD